MNWFNRHINWTYIFGFLVGGGFFQYGSDYYNVVILWIGVIILWVISIWAIKRKGRSLAIILWGLIGILPIVILFMKNKRNDLKESQ